MQPARLKAPSRPCSAGSRSTRAGESPGRRCWNRIRIVSGMAHPQLQPEPSWMLARPPAELTHTRLRRIGEGIGKVVYASDHWVVKRERSTHEIIALIIIWKMLSKLAHI